MLGTVQDITDRKQAEHELARAYAERDAVVLAVAHELRNFVNGIGLSVAVLRHALLSPGSATRH
jgi:signal transduction histidine kinase